MSKPFHQTSAWTKLSKDFKTLRCVDCKSKDDIVAGHILPAAKWKMARLWRYNLVHQCQPCNAKLGSKIHRQPRVIILIVGYGMIKLLMYSVIFITLSLLPRYIYLDVAYNNSTITDQIRNDGYEILTDVISFIERSHSSP